MEDSKITGVDSTHQVPDYGDEKKELSTPSVRSKDGSKENETGNYNAMPAYTDEEGQEGEIHLDTAADIVTQIIDLDDDPTLNPWTFRMFFIGMTDFSIAMCAATTLTLNRHGPFLLRCCSRGDLFLQASGYLCLSQ